MARALFFATGVLTVMRDDNGNLIGLASRIRDTTEGRDNQEKLVEACEQLAVSQKMEAIGKLTEALQMTSESFRMIIGGNAQTFSVCSIRNCHGNEAIQTAAKTWRKRPSIAHFFPPPVSQSTVVDLNGSITNMRTMMKVRCAGKLCTTKSWVGMRPSSRPAELELAIVNIAVNARDATPNGGEAFLDRPAA